MNRFNTLIANAYTDTTYPQICVAIHDYQLREVDRRIVDTSYVAPIEDAE